VWTKIRSSENDEASNETRFVEETISKEKRKKKEADNDRVAIIDVVGRRNVHLTMDSAWGLGVNRRHDRWGGDTEEEERMYRLWMRIIIVPFGRRYTIHNHHRSSLARDQPLGTFWHAHSQCRLTLAWNFLDPSVCQRAAITILTILNRRSGINYQCNNNRTLYLRLWGQIRISWSGIKRKRSYKCNANPSAAANPFSLSSP